MQISDFIEYISFEKRFSKHTIISYKTDLEQFFLYLQTAHEIVDIKHVNHLLIRSWIVSLIEKELNARSVNRKITTLKTYYKFLLKQGIVQENPLLKIQSPKTSKRLPVFVEKDKMDLLLDKVDFGNDFEGLRNKLIVELFYSTGMRLSELINIKVSDVNINQPAVKVLGKRNKERIIPLNNPMIEQIKKYLSEKENNKVSNPENHLFLTTQGKPLYEKFVYRLIKKYLTMVTTIDKKSPHVLRHTFATHMLNNGADLNSIKELLGHANLSATQVYTHNTVEKLKNIHKQAHPKA